MSVPHGKPSTSRHSKYPRRKKLGESERADFSRESHGKFSAFRWRLQVSAFNESPDDRHFSSVSSPPGDHKELPM